MLKWILSILLLSTSAMAEFTVPALPHPVNDYAGVLTAQGKEAIAHEIVQLKKDTGAQVGVLIVNSLDGYDIADAAITVARRWKLGSKGQNGGALLMISVKDRKSRIEVGYGLEGFVTDAKSKQILVSMRPGLKAGNWDAGVLTGIQGLSKVIRDHKEEISKPPVAPKEESSSGAVFMFILFAGLGVIGLFALYSATRKRTKKEIKEEKRAEAAEKRSERRSGRSSGNNYIYAPISKSRDDDDDSSSSSSSSSSDSGSSDSGSDWGGGGGDFGGGGSSDSF